MVLSISLKEQQRKANKPLLWMQAGIQINKNMDIKSIKFDKFMDLM